MNANWYFTTSIYGYEIIIPDEYMTYVNNMYNMVYNKIKLEKPFIIQSILSDFHSNIDGMDDTDLEELDIGAVLVIGFCVQNDMRKNVTLFDELNSLLPHLKVLYEFDTKSRPGIFSGIEWYRIIEHEDNDNDNDNESSYTYSDDSIISNSTTSDSTTSNSTTSDTTE